MIAVLLRSARIPFAGLLVANLLFAALSNPNATLYANPGTLYAAPTSTGSGDCSNWDNACMLQTALADAISGDQIWVKMGIHKPTATADRTISFAMKDGVALYGGFAGTETGRDQRDWMVNITVLSGDIDNNDLADPTGVVTTTAGIIGANSYHIVVAVGVTETAVLDGFTITAGLADGDGPHASPCDGPYCAGGLYSDGGNPTLANLSFSGNASNWGGGGMFNNGGSPTLSHIRFISNTSGSGGGLFNNFNGQPTLVDVIFESNTAGDSGGGMFNQFASPVLINVTFAGNSCIGSGGGGGVVNYFGSPELTNVTFSGNSAGIVGGAMWNRSSNPTLTNVIVWGNTAPSGAGISNDSSTPQISFSDIQGCGGSGSWNSACGADGGGNIEADPLFVYAANGDLRLQLTSPATDAGDNAALPPGILTDLDGNPRFVDVPIVPDTGSGAPPIVDMGAYEVQYVDVALSKAALPPTAAPGEAITFTLTLTNLGSLPATGIVVTDTLPTVLWGVSLTSSLTVTDTGYLPRFVWLAQDLAPGQRGAITVSGALTAPLSAGIYTNTAFFSAADDLLAENNTAVITFTVPNVAPGFTSGPVISAMQNAPYTYTATARDDNGDALTITALDAPGLAHATRPRRRRGDARRYADQR